jgi:hypothetical protein
VGKTCFVYVDDIVIATSDEDHANAVKQVLHRLIMHGMTVTVRKMQVCMDDVEYLGHTVSAGEVKLSKKHRAAISDYPRPTTKNELKRFMGLVRWFRKFVKDYSDMEAPLRACEAAKTRFDWSQDCEEAFVNLKKSLTNDTVLKMIDPKQPFIVYTDASKIGMGCVICQQAAEGGKSYPL